MKQILIFFVAATLIWSCESITESELPTEVTLKARVTKAYGGPFPFVIIGEVENNHTFPVYAIMVRVTTSFASKIIDLSPNALEPGQVGTFSDTVNVEFPTLLATGKASG